MVRTVAFTSTLRSSDNDRSYFLASTVAVNLDTMYVIEGTPAHRPAGGEKKRDFALLLLRNAAHLLPNYKRNSHAEARGAHRALTESGRRQI